MQYANASRFTEQWGAPISKAHGPATCLSWQSRHHTPTYWGNHCLHQGCTGCFAINAAWSNQPVALTWQDPRESVESLPAPEPKNGSNTSRLGPWDVIANTAEVAESGAQLWSHILDHGLPQALASNHQQHLQRHLLQLTHSVDGVGLRPPDPCQALLAPGDRSSQSPKRTYFALGAMAYLQCLNKI